MRRYERRGSVITWGVPNVLASNVKSVHASDKAFVAVTNGGTVVMWGESDMDQVDGYVHFGTDFDLEGWGGSLVRRCPGWSSLSTPLSPWDRDHGSGSSNGNDRFASTSIIIIVCVVGVVVFAAVAFLIRKRFVASHQHHRASMPGLESETQDSA